MSMLINQYVRVTLEEGLRLRWTDFCVTFGCPDRHGTLG